MAQYKQFPMIINTVFIGIVSMRDDQVDYFGVNITAPIPASTKGRKAHTRNLYSKRLDDETATRQVQVGRSLKARDRQKNRVNSGKKIKVPTQLTSTPSASAVDGDGNPITRLPQIRMTTINFPNRASNSEIAIWINNNFTTKKPDYFITSAGARHAVNAGAAPTPTPTPTP